MNTKKARKYHWFGFMVLGPLLFPPPAAAQRTIPWRNEPRATQRMQPAGLARTIAGLAGSGGSNHFVVQFDGPVKPTARAAIRDAGVTLQGYLGQDAFYAVATSHLDAVAAASVPGLMYAGRIDVANKLHPDVANNEMPLWARVPGPDGQTVGAYVVTFHDDVDLGRARTILADMGATSRGEVQLLNAIVAELPIPRAFELAEHDEVAWIEPPLPPMRGGNDQAAVSTQVSLVRAPPYSPSNAYNLTGSGVSVMVHDVGWAGVVLGPPDNGHLDIVGNTINRDLSSYDPGDPEHATHISGSIGGNGSQSPGLIYAGMAPGVKINVYGWRMNGLFSFLDLYTNPQDMEADYTDAILVRGCHISNSSIWSAPTSWGPSACGWMGAYGDCARLIDRIVHGDLPGQTAPFRSVWITGNDRGVGTCGTTYGTVAPPGTAKNTITIGAVTSDTGAMAAFSGWGPTADFRLKPDLVAPGTKSFPVGGGITSCGRLVAQSYVTFSGTSQAAPIVTGASALFIEDFRARYPSAGDPLNSTLKCIYVQTALDGGNAGPDYQFGWGRLQIKAAIDLMRAGAFREKVTVGQGATRIFLVDVRPGMPLTKATLAWDDVAGMPSVYPTLVNDLDLRMISPQGVSYWPWQLNASIPSAPAIQTPVNYQDHVNNVEQVLVTAPAVGRWAVEVSGFSVPQGPQAFSIAFSGGLVTDCNGNHIDDTIDLANGTSHDCDVDGLPDECDIAQQIDKDCNLNGFPDQCDLASLTSPDCNANGIPDECDIASGTSADCNGNGVPDECDVASGSSPDCNGNHVPDECDLANHTSKDCNSNGIPDECETDCNHNGIPDDCDLADGTSADCNGNNIPDSCDLAAHPLDCNGNGIPDSCDIANHTSPDCNDNGLPDSCDPDCNGNGTPDGCDIANGTSTDRNANGIPDDCLADGDCNGNGIPDVVDIQTGGFQDCDGDFVPDVCQPFADCNHNSIRDTCDIAAGTSLDVDGNWIPDECQMVRPVPSQYATIQAAIDAASDGDTVLIANGTYTGVGNKSIDPHGKVLTIRSQNGAANCIIDLQGSGRGFYMHSSEPRTLHVQGLTIRNASLGAGDYGGAFRLTPASPTVSNCVLETNATVDGGAISLYGSRAVFQNCTIRNNTASNQGGGVTAALSLDVRFESCSFADNSAPFGAGVSVSGGGVTFDGCSFTGNNGTAVYINGVGLPSGNCLIQNCMFMTNHAGHAVDIEGNDTRVLSCTFEQNDGGALRTYQCKPLVEYCRIQSNTSTVLNPTATILFSESEPVVRDTWVVGNSNGNGAMQLVNYSSAWAFRVARITGCTIADNVSTSSGGGFGMGGSAAAHLSNCIVWGNTATSGSQIATSSLGLLEIDDSDVQGGLPAVYVWQPYSVSWGAGNIDVTPLFVSPSAGDYHIQRLSPCVNTGSPSFVPQIGETDIDGQPRVLYNRVDMGADEFHL